MAKMLMIPDNIPIPDFNPETQYLGQPEFDENSQEWFFPVVDYTEKQLLKITEQRLSQRRKQVFDIKSQEIALQEIKAITDPKELLQVKEAFPLYDPEKEYLNPNEKVIRILTNGEIALFELSIDESKGEKIEKWIKIS